MKALFDFAENAPRRMKVFVIFLVIGFIGSTMAGITPPLLPLGAKFQQPRKINRQASSQNNEMGEVAIVWEIEDDFFCSHALLPLVNRFQFGDRAGWSRSASNPATLSRGDPLVLTYSFIRDGVNPGSNFGCDVPGEETGSPSNLIAFLDRLYGTGAGGDDLTQRPWFEIFRDAFTNLGRVSGVQYVYEANDDGASVAFNNPGILGVRGDIRIGGHRIDGYAGVLACNFFPDLGEMVVDTDDRLFGPRPPDNRALRNLLEHEFGHGLGINHVCPVNKTKLMEPFLSLDFLGVQADDILAINRGYGDRDEFPEQNDSLETATFLGSLSERGRGMLTRRQISIDGSSDQDYYRFTVSSDARVDIIVTPRGRTYLHGPQDPRTGMCSSGKTFDALTENDLGFELLDQSGTNVLVRATSSPAGVLEQTRDISLGEGAGDYFVHVFGDRDRAQMYDLTVRLTATAADSPLEPEQICFPVSANNGTVTTICL